MGDGSVQGWYTILKYVLVSVCVSLKRIKEFPLQVKGKRKIKEKKKKIVASRVGRILNLSAVVVFGDLTSNPWNNVRWAREQQYLVKDIQLEPLELSLPCFSFQSMLLNTMAKLEYCLKSIFPFSVCRLYSIIESRIERPPDVMLTTPLRRERINCT